MTTQHGGRGGVAYATQPPAHVYGVSSLYTCLFLFAQLHQHSQSAGPTSDAKDICTASSDTSAPHSGMGRAWSKCIIDSSLPSPPHQPVLPSVFFIPALLCTILACPNAPLCLAPLSSLSVPFSFLQFPSKCAQRHLDTVSKIGIGLSFTTGALNKNGNGFGYLSVPLVHAFLVPSIFPLQG